MMLSNYVFVLSGVCIVCVQKILIMNRTELNQRFRLCSFLITLCLQLCFLIFIMLLFWVFLVLLYSTYTHAHISIYYTHTPTKHTYTYLLIHTYIQTYSYAHLCTYTMCIGSIHKNNHVNNIVCLNSFTIIVIKVLVYCVDGI